MEEALNGVPSPLVNAKRHIGLERSAMSLGIWSLATEAVVPEVVDMFMAGYRWIYKDQYSQLREIHWLAQLTVKWQISKQ